MQVACLRPCLGVSLCVRACVFVCVPVASFFGRARGCEAGVLCTTEKQTALETFFACRGPMLDAPC